MRRDVRTQLDAAIGIVESLPLTTSSTVVDLGTGDGVFLEAVGRDLLKRFPEELADPTTLAKRLVGVDVRLSEIRNAERRLTSAFGRPGQGWQLFCGDALSMEFEKGFECVVGNPPWARLHAIARPERDSIRSRFFTAVGAFDLSWAFIERALSLLREDGFLAMIVPRGVGFLPSAQILRALLSAQGQWDIRELPTSVFRGEAGVDPGLLTFRKTGARSKRATSNSLSMTLGDVADVHTGVATGADRLFLIEPSVADKFGLPPEWIRPAIRGRDIGEHSPKRVLVWPYEHNGAGWRLRLSDSVEQLGSFLKPNREELADRWLRRVPIRRNSAWYAFIDPGRTPPDRDTLRFAVPIIFRGARFEALGPQTAIMNTCLELRPHLGYETVVLQLLRSAAFWEHLRKTSRRLRNGYFRTSAGELRRVPLTHPAP